MCDDEFPTVKAIVPSNIKQLTTVDMFGIEIKGEKLLFFKLGMKILGLDIYSTIRTKSTILSSEQNIVEQSFYSVYISYQYWQLSRWTGNLINIIYFQYTLKVHVYNFYCNYSYIQSSHPRYQLVSYSPVHNSEWST